MLYSFFGTDIAGARREAQEFIGTYEVRGGVVVRIDRDHYTTGVLVDAAGSASLFADERIYVIDTPSEDAGLFEDVFANLELLSQSANTFVLIEGGLLAAQKKKLQKHSAELVEVSAGKAERFNIFSLADALSRRDKKSLWILLTQARQHGASDEEIIGTFFWQLKSLRLAAAAESPEAAGMKPFVYTKAKRALGKFSGSEIAKMSRTLLVLYHEGHRGQRDLSSALEQWVLRL